MKAALNGALNASILDGGGDECFDGENGWAISSAEMLDDERRDEVEAHSLFELLERQIVPLFYDRPGPAPRGWLKRVKHAFATLGPAVTASRMVKDYTRELYEPTGEHADRLSADGFAVARDLAAWKARVREAWHGVHVDGIEAGTDPADVGEERTVTAVVSLGDLTPDDVTVQLVHGTVVRDGELVDVEIIAMETSDKVDDHLRYEGTLPNPRAGRRGVTVRVVPNHPGLVTPVELGHIAWA